MLALGWSFGCVAPDGGEPPIEPADLGDGVAVVVDPAPAPERQAEYDALTRSATEARDRDYASLAPEYAVPHVEALGYAPSAAANLDLIQASDLSLDDDEMAALDARGFMISERQRFPSFVYGYESIYSADLPVYISADSILHAVHRSFDEILKYIEYASLVDELDALLDGMRGRLAAGELRAFGEEVQRDVDLYLAVARGLLAGSHATESYAPVAGASDAEVRALINSAEGAVGAGSVTLFGTGRMLDFSQFQPRGHYGSWPPLWKYFRAMMWLGRVDLRLIETQPDGSRVFQRDQLGVALALDALMGETGRARWQRIEDTIAAFIGESDNMTPADVAALLDDLGAEDAVDALRRTDAELAQAIVEGGYGQQRIASHLVVNGVDGTLTTNASFLLFGQRYTVDSHVFSNVVFDRVRDGELARMMPDPLDAAFAALGNDHALDLLSSEMEAGDYAGDLHAMRLLVEAHEGTYWDGSLYTSWLSALRGLSPSLDEAAPGASGLPAVAGTEAWGRRVLNTQLASWAELRHDTILYTKQSYTGGLICEFPDAYVDPYPEFFRRLQRFAERGRRLVDVVDAGEPWLRDQIEEYFHGLGATAEILTGMAERQRTGEPFTDSQMEFVNQIVRIAWGCVGPQGVDGWYGRLFFNQETAVEFDPTIADVHTQPTDVAGSTVGRVLHVGVGAPRLMVVTIDTCTGPRAYVGLASSYFEQTTENFVRMTDVEWSEQITDGNPDDVPWMADLVVR